MKSGEIIGIAGGATVLGGIVWFIYGIMKNAKPPVDPSEHKNYKEPDEETYAGGATRSRSTKKTHNNIKNIKKGTKKR